MKIRVDKKSFSNKRATKVLLIFIALLIAISVPMAMVQKVSADQYDDKIAALQRDIDSYNSQATQLASQAKTLQNAVASLHSQATVIQVQIDISQAKYDKLVAQIADTEKQIKDNQDALGKTIANMYVDDRITPLEMLASSKNIGDYLDKQEYRSSVRSQLTNTISKIKDLKNQLDKQKIDVEYALADQQNSKNALLAKQQEQQALLTQTQGQESAYQQLVASRQDDINKIKAAQDAWKAQWSGGVDSSEYSQVWNDSNCKMGSQYNPDLPGYYSWVGADGIGGDGHGYGCRQCASYAAWRVYKATTHYPENWGNAVDFPGSAASIYDEGSVPRENSLAIMSAAVAGNDGQGHVVWVESVNDDDTITVSQYNANIKDNNGEYIGYGQYSKVKMSPYLFYKYIYIN